MDQIDAAIKSFNQAKAQRLEKINQEGKQLKAGIEAREKDILAAKEAIDSLAECIQGIDSTLEIKIKELAEISTAKADTSALEQKKVGLENEIQAIKNCSGIRERDITEKINETRDKIAAWNNQDAEHKTAEKARDRIRDLEQQEKTLVAEYEALEKELFLTETFIRRKVELLEDSINSRFKMARFKMFSEQINGGLSECCEILYQGVPFDRGLNKGAQTMVGADIINTLSFTLYSLMLLSCNVRVLMTFWLPDYTKWVANVA